MRGCSPLSVIIIHDQAGVNDSWNPAKQRQNYAEKETGNTTGHEHSQRRENHAEKISQRFHHELFLAKRPVGCRGDRMRARFVLLFECWALDACSRLIGVRRRASWSRSLSRLGAS